MNSQLISFLFISIWVLASGAKDFASKTIFTENVKAITKNLGGINCLVGSVFNVEDAANDFIYDIEVCHVEPSDRVAKIVAYSEHITVKTGKIVDADDDICRNAAYNESDADQPAPEGCALQMQKLMANLYDAVYNTYTYLSAQSNIENSCSATAATFLQSSLPTFPEAIDKCAILFN